MRTFIAIKVPKKIREKINNFIEEQKKKGLPIKWVKFENLHITLKFLGEIDDKKKKEITQVIKGLANKFSHFSVTFEGIGCFPNQRNPRVLWIGVSEGSEQLCLIAKDLETTLSRCGFKEEKRFHPHLTIGRIKKFCKVDDILENQFKSEPFSADSIILFKSTLKPEGPIYDELQKFILNRSAI